MGYERCRFKRQSFPVEMICRLCEEVLEDPQQCLQCKKFFCRACLASKRKTQQDCLHPVSSLVNPNRFLVQKLAGLELCCRFSMTGCTYQGKMNAVGKHEKVCEYFDSTSSPVKMRNYSPEKSFISDTSLRVIKCPKGCGKKYTIAEQEEHNCIKELLQTTQMQHERNFRIQSELNQKRNELNHIRSDLGSFQIIEGDRVLKLIKSLTEKRETLNKLIVSNSESLNQISIKHSQQMTDLDSVSLSQISSKMTQASSVMEDYFSDFSKLISSYTFKNKSSLSHFRIKLKADTADFCRVDSLPRFNTAKNSEIMESLVNTAISNITSRLLATQKFKTPSKAKSFSYTITTPSTLSNTCKL